MWLFAQLIVFLNLDIARNLSLCVSVVIFLQALLNVAAVSRRIERAKKEATGGICFSDLVL